MFGLSKYALIAALSAVIGLGGWVWLERADNARLSAENARLSRNIVALRQMANDNAHARRVEAARVIMWKERAAKLDASIEALFTGDIEDVPLDPRIADFINGLHEGD